MTFLILQKFVSVKVNKLFLFKLKMKFLQQIIQDGFENLESQISIHTD